MNVRKIHQVLLGGKADARTQEWMMSFRRFHSLSWEFFLWTEENVHELGLEPWQWEHSDAAGSANLIRLYAILRHGGIYSDLDVECLKPLDPLLQYDAFCAIQPDEPKIACNAVFGAKAEHPWIKWQIDNLGDIRTKDASWACYLMEAARPAYSEVETILTHWVYPFGHLAKPEDRKPHPESFVQHFWSGSWCKNERGAESAV